MGFKTDMQNEIDNALLTIRNTSGAYQTKLDTRIDRINDYTPLKQPDGSPATTVLQKRKAVARRLYDHFHNLQQNGKRAEDGAVTDATLDAEDTADE